VRKSWWVSGILTGVLGLDLLTKSWALTALADGRRMELLGGLLPLTLAFNRGAAFGLTIGSDPRWIFVPVTFVALFFLAQLVREASPHDYLRVCAASLVAGGALGNLYDRLRWNVGVVDFLGPVDLGFALFPIFNVADIGITIGGILLAISLWSEDVRVHRENRAEGAE